MKLATYRDGSRDGQLVVVSRDLTQAHYANGIAGRLQQVLDDWNFLSPQLEDLSTTLNHGRARHAFAFDPRLCMAPLPRAYAHVEALAYPAHARRLCQAHGVAVPTRGDTPSAATMRGGDGLLGAVEPLRLPADSGAMLDFGAGLAVLTGDIEAGADAARCLEAVRLLLLVNGWRLRPSATEGATLATLFNVPPGGTPSAFAPLAVTPDELGDAWRGGRVHLPLQVQLNGRKAALIDAAAQMDFHFGQLLAHLARQRRLGAGSIVGAGPVAGDAATQGFACLAERRAHEAETAGAAKTAWLRVGDRVRIEVKGRDGGSVFGAIDQTVVGADGAEVAPAPVEPEAAPLPVETDAAPLPVETEAAPPPDETNQADHPPGGTDTAPPPAGASLADSGRAPTAADVEDAAAPERTTGGTPPAPR